MDLAHQVRTPRRCARPGHACYVMLLSLACLASVACDDGPAESTAPTAPIAPSRPVFTTVTILHDTATLEPGDELTLTIRALDATGTLINDPGTVTLSSDAPSVASVQRTSLGAVVLTAVAPGSASITTSVTIDGVTRTASTRVDVVAPAIRDTLVFTYVGSLTASGFDRWRGHVVAGGLVRWTGLGAYTKVELFDAANTGVLIDTVHVSSGSASHTFRTPGRFVFCLGDCLGSWGGPGGTIYVH